MESFPATAERYFRYQRLAGGHSGKSAYYEVCNGKTGHAEVVQIEFDPAKSYEKLAGRFLHAHTRTASTSAGRRPAISLHHFCIAMKIKN